MTAATETMPLLAAGAAELGVALTAAQLDQFAVYYRELAAANQRVNLTSVIDYEGVQVRHFLDSLTLIAALGGPAALTKPGLRVVDVGAGAGFPGVPLKLVFPGLRLDLVEATGKKADFLRQLIAVLDLDGVAVHWGRAEELAHQPELRAAFDLTLARGVAKLPTLLEYTLPFTRRGGLMAAWKHGGIDQELAAAQGALRILGGRLEPAYPVTLPGLTDDRIIVLAVKETATPGRYPRRPGMPGKQPLGNEF